MLKSLNWHTLEYIRNALVHVDHHHLISTRNLNYLIPHSKLSITQILTSLEQYVSGIRFQAQYRLAQA